MMNMKRLLKLKIKKKKKKPNFIRQEAKKMKKLDKVWRKPRGRDSKLKKQKKARGRLPSPGFRCPKEVRGLNRQGLNEIRIFNPSDLDNLDSKKDIAVLGSTVGKRKRMEIIKKAEEKNIKISNFSI